MSDLVTVPQTTDPELAEEEHYTHIIGPIYTDEDKISGVSRLMNAVVHGFAVTALCGYTWVPCRDPEKYPLCPACKAIVERKGD